MKNLRVAEARARFGEILDEAEKGNPVTIERRGVYFRLVADATGPAKSSKRLFSSVDPAVMSGQWTWTMGMGGLKFSARRKKR